MGGVESERSGTVTKEDPNSIVTSVSYSNIELAVMVEIARR